MRLALAQINPTVGDVAGNTDRIRRAIERAGAAGADLVVLPELAVVGYPPKDLLLKPAVIDRCSEAVETLAEGCRGISAIIGHPARSAKVRGRALHNAAALCAEGRVQAVHHKSLLPTYDVFDEHRYFEPGPAVDLTSLHGRNLGISICEDLWNEQRVFSRQLYHDNPLDQLAAMGADLFINCAASPFVVRKQPFRLKLMSRIAWKNAIPLMYCNQVGGNDELIFDGGSCAFDSEGRLIAHAAAFEEDLLLVDLPMGEPSEERSQEPGVRSQESEDKRQKNVDTSSASEDQQSPSAIGNRRAAIANRRADIRHQTSDIRHAFHALTLGLGDYVRKCGFDSVVLGLSGGIDSAVTAAICVAALGSEHVRGITMPSRYSSAGAGDDSQALATNLGITLDTVPIEQPHAAFEHLLQPYFAGRERDVSEENIQARIRGLILMAFSNKFGALLVTTGNKSEVAVGYCTLYGDMAGGLAVLSDVPKTMVWDLAQWVNDDPASPLRERFGQAVIPQNTITKPPSAELREDQKDEDSLPPYEVLDPIIERYVEREHSVERIIEQTGHERDLVSRIAKLIDRNEYKRKQMPPGLKITSRAFGFGRRMPIAQRFDNRAALATTSREA